MNGREQIEHGNAPYVHTPLSRTRPDNESVTYELCAVCCSVLQCVPWCCSVLQQVAMCCNEVDLPLFTIDTPYYYCVLQCLAVFCKVLQCVAA